MPEITPADELRAAAAILRDMPGTVRGVIATREDDAWTDEHTVVVCECDHAPPAVIDRYGCCADCRFIGGYDRELAHAVAVLLTVPGPLALLLGHVADDMAKYSAVAVARAVNAAAQAAERTS